MRTNQACASCHFYGGDRDKAHGTGICYRYPPVVAGIVGRQTVLGQAEPQIMMGLVTVQCEHWCGEWKSEIMQ